MKQKPLIQNIMYRMPSIYVRAVHIHTNNTGIIFAADGKYVITACYDNTVSIWDIETGAKKLTIPGHCGPARAVAWINPTSFRSESSSSQSQVGTFASTSHDQTVMLYRYI